jgi:Peptidase A4 family
VASVVVAVGFAGTAGPTGLVRGHATGSARTDVSSNWAGYVATGLGSTPTTASSSMSYTDVTGQWVQPRASCKAGSPTSVAIWVGLGGYSESSQELEQVGTSADCDAHGQASYYVWYELVPADSVNLNLKISPGDTIVSVVKVSGTDVLLQVIDRTRRTRFTRHLAMASPDLSSAEWIAEAPSQCNDSGFCKQLALTRFGSFAFTRTFAVGNSVGGTITSPAWTSTALQLVPRSHRFFGDPNDPTASAGLAGAAPSPLLADGSGFTLTWQANPSVPVS